MEVLPTSRLLPFNPETPLTTSDVDAAARVAAALARWRERLIDLSRRNPLIGLRQTRHLPIVLSSPGSGELLRGLLNGQSWRLWMPPQLTPLDEPAAKSRLRTQPDEIVCGDLERSELILSLTLLSKRARADFQERGLHTTFLVLGVLEWPEDPLQPPVRSPLVLLPISLSGTGTGPFTINPVEGEPIINPALRLRLERGSHITLPELPAGIANPERAATALAEFFAAVSILVADREGWRVERETLLTMLAFEKAVIHQDLTAHAHQVAQHPLIRALAGESSEIFQTSYTIPEEKELDQTDPRQSFAVLDADSSQRHCLEAARAGQSFVLIGPPGTGKSQTIANLIADSLARNKTVLFVSAKAAALDVVYRRLQRAGLDDFCLELHSQHTQRGRVVQELYRSLHSRMELPPEPDASEFERLIQLRDRLNAYPAALHTRRSPLGRSVAEALDALTRRNCVLAVPLQVESIRQRDAAWLDSAERAVAELARLSPIIRESTDYVWIGFNTAEPLTGERLRTLRECLDEVIHCCRLAQESARKISQTLGISGDPTWLAQVAKHLAARPNVPETWLTRLDPSIGQELQRLAQTHTALRSQRVTLTERYGPAIWELPNGCAGQVESAVHQLLSCLADEADQHGLFSKRHDLREWANHLSRSAEIIRSAVARLAQAVGLRLSDPTPRQIRTLVRLLERLPITEAPPSEWLNARVVQELRTRFSTLAPRLTALQADLAEVRQLYDESVLDTDLPGLASRMAARNESWLKHFWPPHYWDRANLRKYRRDGRLPVDCLMEVRRLREIAANRTAVLAEIQALREWLGPYYAGVVTPILRANQALEIAADVCQACTWLGSSAVPSELQKLIVSGQSLPPESLAVRESLCEVLRIVEISENTLTGIIPDSTDLPLSVIVQRCGVIRAALDALDAALMPVMLRPLSRPTTLRRLAEDLRQTELVRSWIETERGESAARRERFGEMYRGWEDTDWSALQAAWAWTEQAHKLIPNRDLRHIHIPPQPAELTGVLLRVESARQVLARFWAGSSVEIPTPIAGLTQWAEVRRANLEYLRDWYDWQRLPEQFATLGLTDFYRRVLDTYLPLESLCDIFRKSFDLAWVEAWLAADADLRQFRGLEFERLILEFTRQDRRLIALTAGRVARRARQARPVDPRPIPGSEVERLQRQALLKSRHTPLRQLFADLPNLLPKLKPCLLMSPLSVSQFLADSTTKFDVVVFDEASQLPTEDALSAISRGRQVIVAGDDQQLPPTEFFAFGTSPTTIVSDGPEYASILDHCRNVLPIHQLRWHYRSKHGSLIAFSNRHFYHDRLVTFPSPEPAGERLGIRLHYVEDGVYDRGGRRDNRREAEVVADLVCEQLRKEPSKTVGVIAFSQAQMWAIQAQLERRRRADAELERFFTDDRLEGVFVRNLETVQGDERDVIFLSIGYGRDRDGRPAMNFGPLNRSGGEKRLNVAVTRAKERLTVVSSLRPGEVRLRPNSPEGVRLLRQYLEFAAGATLPPAPLAGPERQPSGLVNELRNLLRTWGYDSLADVGYGGRRIDLAVRDPQRPERFLLGLLLDGEYYRASATARDRERLWPEILTAFGWRLHRVWAVDWLAQPERETARLRQTLEQARIAPQVSLPSYEQSLIPTLLTRSEAEPELPIAGTTPYELAELTVSEEWRATDFVGELLRPVQGELLDKLVNVEGPIRRDWAIRRLAGAWGIDRLIEKIRTAGEDIVRRTVIAGKVRDDGEFLWPAEERAVMVRVPVAGIALTQRLAEQIAPAEWDAALRLVVEAGVCVERLGAIKQTAKIFGLRPTPSVRSLIATRLDRLLLLGDLVSQGEMIRVRESMEVVTA